MKKKHLKISSIIMALLITMSSCVSSTYIESSPSGADLFLNGEAVGQTPYRITDTKIAFSCTTVRIEKEDYQTHYTSIYRDEEADVGAIIGGFLFVFPFLWTLKYKPHHYYKLNPLNDEDSSKHKNENYDGFEMLIEDTED